jgi:catechol 2,3-dioxygenase-like lactoylglutathione lyase family enzyme
VPAGGSRRKSGKPGYQMTEQGSQPLELGWGQYCLNVEDINVSWEFYRKIGFSLAGGKLEEKWAVLHNGETELGLFQGMLKGSIVNFRGIHIQQLAAELKARGFDLDSETDYDAEKYPAEWHQDPEGRTLPLEGSGSFNVFDPGGVCLFFDTVPVERATYTGGARFSFEAGGGTVANGHPVLGDSTICLSVDDIAKSAAFYEGLGMRRSEGDLGEGWLVFTNDAPRSFRIGLFSKEHIAEHMINFRGGNVFEIADRLKGEGLELESGPETESDGSDGLMLRDPDNNLIYFNTAPQERQY